MPRFEDRLWSEIVEQHGALLAQPPLLGAPSAAAVPRTRSRRRLSLVGAAAGFAAAAIAAIVLLSSGGGPAPAYAIIQHPDGSVTVTMRELLAVPEANEKLEALGLPVRAVEVKADCTATATGHFVRNPGARPIFTPVFSKEGSGVTLDPKAVPSGDTLVIAGEEPQPGQFDGKAGLYEGAVPSCLPSAPTQG